MGDNKIDWETDQDEVDFIPMERRKSAQSHTSTKSKVSFAKEDCVLSFNTDDEDIPYSLKRVARKSFKENSNRIGSLVSNTNFVSKQPGFGIIHFAALKIIFWDMMISIGDVASDFMQGFSLIMTPGHGIYGWVTIAINWLPGFTAALHLVSMYRGDLGVKNTFVYCGLLILLYPLVPIIAFGALLWHNQNDLDNKKKMKKFRQAEYRAMISHAIAGGIESPVQFILQIWLILNGIRPLPWYEYGTITLTDWKGNAIYLPTTSTISILFSMLSMLKAVIEFNILRVHIQDITDWSRTLDFGVLIFDHLPFLTTSTFFRVLAISILVTYFHTFGFIPVFIFLFFNLVYGYNNFDLSNIPLWLVSCISTFFPVCMTTAQVSKRNRINIVNLQYKTFKYQSIFSVLCYGPALLAVMGIINFYKGYNYDGHIILDNLSFNINIGIILLMGGLSILMSTNPSFNQLCRSAYRYLNPSFTKSIVNDKIQRESRIIDEELMEQIMCNPPNKSSFENDNRVHLLPPHKVCNIFRNCLTVIVIFVPIVLVNVILTLTQQSYGYVYFRVNSSHILSLKGIYLNGPQVDVNGIMTFYYGETKNPLSNFENDHYKNTITRILRPEWEPSLSSSTLENAMAIVIVDDAPYRPSSPIPVETNGNAKMPIILLQQPEGLFLPNDQKLVHLTFDPYGVPSPEWSCDIASSESGFCFKPKINSSTRAIRGIQYRKKECMWGTKPCMGFSNKLEQMNECEGPEIPLCTKNSFVAQPLRTENQSTFKLEISPRNCIPRTRIVKHGDCPIWSKWLKWRESQVLSAVYPGHLQIQRIRYCIANFNGISNCIFRDNEYINCCYRSKGLCDASPLTLLPPCEF